MSWKPVFNNFLRAGASLCLGSALFIPVAQAQFNGPALTSSTTVNVPVVLTTDPAILYPTFRDIRLFPSDQITVHLYGSIDYVPVVRVGLDGSIDLPLVGRLQVKGLTLEQAERLIEQKLIAGGMYRNPQVNLQITDSPNQVATVAGELHCGRANRRTAQADGCSFGSRWADSALESRDYDSAPGRRSTDRRRSRQ